MNSAIFVLFERASVMLVAMYFAFQFQITKRILRKPTSLSQSLWIGVLGGILGILGTYLGIFYKGAILNYRDTGVIVSTMIGGLPSGLISAAIAAVQRLSLGGTTAFPCFLGTFTVGIVTGILSLKYGRRIFNVPFSIVYTAIIELVHLSFVYFIVQPHYLAVDIAKTVMFPMVFTNTFAVSMLIAIFSGTEKSFEDITATTTSSLFKIVEDSMNIIDRGLSMKTSKLLAKKIKKYTDFNAISITNKTTVLAHVGAGEDHHLPGSSIMTKATKEILSHGKERIIDKKSDIGCPKNDCPLRSAIIVPLKSVDGIVFGTIKFYRTKEYAISKSDLEFAKGLAQIISIEANLSRALKDSKMVYDIKYRALLSKFSPHFLFNALNAISYLIKNDREKAREMILELSRLLRYTIKEEKAVVSLKKELEFVEHYLKFMKYRYDDEFNYEISSNAPENLMVPFFLFHPIVENSVKHAKIPSKKLKVIVKCIYNKSGTLTFSVKDNGKGFKIQKIHEGLGTKLIKERLENLYGDTAKLHIRSNLYKGTSVKIEIPVMDTQRVNAS